MKTTIEDIFKTLCEIAPLDLQLEFDNSGFLVGRRDSEVQRVLLALDITGDVIEEAIACRAELIVSHHPIIFHKLRAVSDTWNDDKVLRLAENRIGAICMHTNLDIARGGVNDVLLSLLGGGEGEPLDRDGCGRVGQLPASLALPVFLRECKERLQAPGLRYYDAGRSVRRLAVMGGAGGDALLDAYQKGCDTYLTADIKYHQFLQAAELGLNLIDAGHFCTENPVIPVLSHALQERFPDVEFLVSERHHAIVSFV